MERWIAVLGVAGPRNMGGASPCEPKLTAVVMTAPVGIESEVGAINFMPLVAAAGIACRTRGEEHLPGELTPRAGEAGPGSVPRAPSGAGRAGAGTEAAPAIDLDISIGWVMTAVCTTVARGPESTAAPVE
mmetsp:Transcript_91151/g.294519  ORF Transcript_91151/g.294519 Transcript_91151/m.294519 type:complete len:131 (+) Transcript_91151:705-1097(+)